MDKMEIAYIKNLYNIYDAIKSKLCGESNIGLEELIVQKKYELMIADQSFTTDISVIDSYKWNECAQEFKMALQGVFGYITHNHYADIENDSEKLLLYNNIKKLPMHNCYDKKSSYMVENYPQFFDNYQRVYKKSFKNRDKKKIKDIYNNYLRQIHTVSLMEVLIELDSKIKNLYVKLNPYLYAEEQINNNVLASKDADKINSVLNIIESMSADNKKELIKQISKGIDN